MTSAEEIIKKEITIFADRIRLDVLTATPGITFADSWRRRKTMTYEGQVFEVLSFADLVKSKTVAGRKVDLDDVSVLTSVEQESNTED